MTTILVARPFFCLFGDGWDDDVGVGLLTYSLLLLLLLQIMLMNIDDDGKNVNDDKDIGGRMLI